jgi:haloalkane dehalogenase
MSESAISADPRYPRSFINVDGRRMAAVVVEGPARDSDTIVFVHGNATSSYMWRNIMPHLEGQARLIAIDNIGQGDSDKLPDSGPDSYMLPEHQRYFDGAMAALAGTGRVTLVMHDWGGTLGLDWAERHPERLKGLAHCEIVVVDHESYESYPDGHGERLRRARGPEGEALVLEDNFFVERVFTGGVMRTIDEETMAHIRRPYLQPGEARRPTLSWVRQIPIGGEPASVAAQSARLAAWMATTPVPKLFIRGDPGQIVFGRDFDVIATWPNQTTITVRGLHHPQEDSPDDIGRDLAGWYRDLP